MSKEKMVRFGPCIVPQYRGDAFSRFPSGIDFMEVWKIVGPTVEHNMNQPRRNAMATVEAVLRGLP